MSGFELNALHSVFRAINEANLDLVLVGGHAVSYYAAKYHDRCPELLRFFPLRSKDADWIGTIEDGMRLASVLHLGWQRNPRKGGMQGLSLGRIELPVPPGGKIEILGKVLGADAEEIRETAVTESAGDFTIRVINPLLLHQTKGINLATIPQRGGQGGRQDAKQFTVMGVIVAKLLSEFATTIGNERALIKGAGRLLDFCLTKDGAALVKGGAMDPFVLLPLSLMETHENESVRNLVSKRLPHFRGRLDVALEKVPLEQAEKIRRDLQQLEAELGTQNRGGGLSPRLERGLGSWPSPPRPGPRGTDTERGPDLGR